MRTTREMIVNTWRVVFASRDAHASLIDLTKIVIYVEPLADRLRAAASAAVRRKVKTTLDAVVLLGADQVGVHAQALLRDWHAVADANPAWITAPDTHQMTASAAG